jgi:hypothetical protein
LQAIAEQPLGGLVFWKPILERMHPVTPNTWSRESDFARSRHHLNGSYLTSSFGKEGSRLQFKVVHPVRRIQIRINSVRVHV